MTTKVVYWLHKVNVTILAAIEITESMIPGLRIVHAALKYIADRTERDYCMTLI